MQFVKNFEFVKNLTNYIFDEFNVFKKLLFWRIMNFMNRGSSAPGCQRSMDRQWQCNQSEVLKMYWQPGLRCYFFTHWYITCKMNCAKKVTEQPSSTAWIKKNTYNVFYSVCWRRMSDHWIHKWDVFHFNNSSRLGPGFPVLGFPPTETLARTDNKLR